MLLRRAKAAGCWGREGAGARGSVSLRESRGRQRGEPGGSSGTDSPLCHGGAGQAQRLAWEVLRCRTGIGF